MAGGGQVATATQPNSAPNGQTYGGVLGGRMEPQPMAQPQQVPQSMQLVQQMAQQMPHNRGSFSDQNMEDGTMASFEYKPQPQPQTPLGIAGLQNNLPQSVGMPAGNMGGMGGMGGTDVIVHGMPVGGQQGMNGLKQQLMGQQAGQGGYTPTPMGNPDLSVNY